MHQLKPLEDAILEQYQFILDEFESDNVVSELVFGFVEYCSGCIAMFNKLNPEVSFRELRPFFGLDPDPRPLISTNEAAFWVNDLSGKLEQQLREKNEADTGAMEN